MMQVQEIRTGAGDQTGGQGGGAHETGGAGDMKREKLNASPRFLLPLDVFSISENPPKYPSEFKYLGCVFLHQFAEMKIFHHHYSDTNKHRLFFTCANVIGCC